MTRPGRSEAVVLEIGGMPAGAPSLAAEPRPRRFSRAESARADDGSVSLELVLLTPLVLILVAFIVLVGRLVDLRLQVESAAHQGARVASQQPDPAMAATAAAELVTAAGAGLGPSCTSPTTVTDTSRWAPGGVVVVTVTCQAALDDLTLLPVPASVAVSAEFTSPVDRFSGATP